MFSISSVAFECRDNNYTWFTLRGSVDSEKSWGFSESIFSYLQSSPAAGRLDDDGRSPGLPSGVRLIPVGSIVPPQVALAATAATEGHCHDSPSETLGRAI